MSKRFLSVLALSAFPLAALAQQAMDPGILAAFMESCLESSGATGSGRTPEESEEFCKCAAKEMFDPSTDEVDAFAILGTCSPELIPLMQGG